MGALHLRVIFETHLSYFFMPLLASYASMGQVVRTTELTCTLVLLVLATLASSIILAMHFIHNRECLSSITHHPSKWCSFSRHSMAIPFPLTLTIFTNVGRGLALTNPSFYYLGQQMLTNYPMLSSRYIMGISYNYLLYGLCNGATYLQHFLILSFFVEGIECYLQYFLILSSFLIFSSVT